MVEIPGFELVRLLGVGGFGSVWLARQSSVDREVAVKIGHQPLLDDTAKMRFDRECRALGRLSGNANIVTVHVTGTLDDGRPYLVLEYVGGGTLWQRVEERELSTLELAEIGLQLCDALELAHRLDVLHRDIKPHNVLLRPNGSIVLGDFGIAVLRDATASASAAVTATVPYSAPEILSGARATVASDLYAIGATILAAATRSTPFGSPTDDNIAAILSRVLTTEPPDLRHHGYAPDLASLVGELLAKDPGRRPASAVEAKAAFRAVIDGGETSGRASAGGGDRTTSAAGLGSSGAGGAADGRPVAAAVTITAPPPDDRIGGTPELGRERPGTRSAGPRRRGVALWTLLSLVVMVMAGTATYLASRAETDPVGRGGGVAGPGSLPLAVDGPTSSAGAAPTASDPTAAPDSSTTPATTVPDLGPIGLPLTAEDAGLPDVSTSGDFTPGPDEHGFCNVVIDETGLAELQAGWINDLVGNDSIVQYAARFERERDADRFLTAIADSLICTSANHTTIDGAQHYTSSSVLVEPVRDFGDDVLAWQSTLTFENGFVVTQRGYVVRRVDRIVSVSSATDEVERLERIPELMSLMLQRLGYDA